MAKGIYRTLILLSIFLQIIPDGESSMEATKLLNHLLSNYQLLARPVKNESDTLTLTLGVTLMQIFDLYEREGILKTLLWQSLEWNDAGLVWDPKEYGNITDVRIPPHRIWKPDILIYNSVDAEFDGTYQTPTVVRSTGDITYIPPGVHATNCRMLYVNFPFDHHRCSIKFGSWAAHGSMIDLQFKKDQDKMDISSFIPHLEWKLLDAPGVRDVIHYSCCPEPYVSITYTIHVQRRGEHILANAKGSNIFICLTLFLSFLIPASSGHKITFGILHLCNVWYTLWSFTNRYPTLIENSEDGGGPLIVYFQVLKVLSELALAANVCTFWLFRITEPMPAWLRKHVVQRISKASIFAGRNLPADAVALHGGSEPEEDEANPGLEKVRQNEWQYLANMTDRSFLVLFTLIFFIIWLSVFPSFE